MSDSPDYRLYIESKFKSLSDEVHGLRLDVRAGAQSLRDLLDEIKSETQGQEKRMTDLELANAYRSGQRATLVAVGAAIGGLVGIVVQFIIDRVKGHP